MNLHFKTLLFSSLLSAGNSVLALKTDAVTSSSSQHDEKTATDAAAFPVPPQLRFMKRNDGDESSSRRLGRGHHGWRRSKKAPELDGKTHDDVCPLEASLGKTIFFQAGPYCVKAELFPSGTMTLDTLNSDCTPENESTGTNTISYFVDFSKENKTVQFSGQYSGDLCLKENAQQTEEQMANVELGDQNTFTVDLSYPSCPEVDPVFLFGMDYKEESCNECVPYKDFYEEYLMGLDAFYGEFKNTTTDYGVVSELLEENDILDEDGSMMALYFIFGSQLVSDLMNFPKLCESGSYLTFTNDMHTDAVCTVVNIFESFCIGEASCDETMLPNFVAARGDLFLNNVDEETLAFLFCTYEGRTSSVCLETFYVDYYLGKIQTLLFIIDNYMPGGTSNPLLTAGYGYAFSPYNDNFVIGDGLMQFFDVILPEEQQNYVAASLAALQPLTEQYLPDFSADPGEVYWFAIETLGGYFYEKNIYSEEISRTNVEVAVEIYSQYPCAHKLGHMAATICKLPIESLTVFVGAYSEYLLEGGNSDNMCELIDETLGCNGVVDPNDASGVVIESPIDCLNFLFSDGEERVLNFWK